MSDQGSIDQDKYSFLVTFGQEGSTELAVAGGKGASLGRLAAAGFPVPSGFIIATAAYDTCLCANDLEGKISGILEEIDYDDVENLEKETEKIRDAITGCKIPDDLAEEILRAYGDLGDDAYVAIRSSGTAEDLEGASFAGQYDTYLDIRGAARLLDAVLRCWASMWTARVAAYRQDKGFDRDDIGIAVVVQTMVDSEVAGVAFTGNPMNARADEYLINASWKLGESVVSGSVTPDEFIVDRQSLKIKRRTLGTKEIQVVRNREAGFGTRTEAVPDHLQQQYTLSDTEVSELAEMSRRVTDYYDGLPQDIEWAFAGGALFLLQSRPVTAVDFTWEEDLDLWPDLPEDDEVIWSRAWADEVWTGAITPLMWSIRGQWMKAACENSYPRFDMEDLADLRAYKYSKGTVYYDTRADLLISKYILPSALREPLLSRLHPSQIEVAMKAPFDLMGCVNMLRRLEEDEPERGMYREFVDGGAMIKTVGMGEQGFDQRLNFVKSVPLPSETELQSLEDDELKQRLELTIQAFGQGVDWGLIYIYQPVIRSLLQGVVRYWYDGDNPNAYTELTSGLPERTQAFQDDYDFWQLGDEIRRSEKLRTLMDEYEGAVFFEELKNCPEGRGFLEKYEAFLEMNFFRGQADRDMYFPRRTEDPMIDYEALKKFAFTDGLEPPEIRETKLNERREAVTSEVTENLKQQPMGELKVAIFKLLLDYCVQSLIARDNSRCLTDFTTWMKKLTVKEIGRRTVSRGVLDGTDDYWFLSLDEIFRLLEGNEPLVLARAKVAGRRESFNRFQNHVEDPTMFLKGDTPMDSDQTPDRDGVITGMGTSPGTVTGRARVIATQRDIKQLEKGDILVCHGTDPGWTPAFSFVSGVVAQTGGAIAHFSCLSREYGIPAVSIPGAMKLIEDGSTITVNGSTGEVQLATRAER